MTYHQTRHGQQYSEDDANHNGSLASGHGRLLRLLRPGFLGQFLGVLPREQGLDELLNLEPIISLPVTQHVLRSDVCIPLRTAR